MVFSMVSRAVPQGSDCNETSGSTIGGFMHGMMPNHPYVDHALNFMLSLFILSVVDHLIIKPWVARHVKHTRDIVTARWYGRRIERETRTDIHT